MSFLHKLSSHSSKQNKRRAEPKFILFSVKCFLSLLLLVMILWGDDDDWWLDDDRILAPCPLPSRQFDAWIVSFSELRLLRAVLCEEREIDPILTCASPRDGPIRAAYVARDPGQPIRAAHRTGAYVGQPIRAAYVASDLVLSRTAKKNYALSGDFHFWRNKDEIFCHPLKYLFMACIWAFCVF